MRRFLYRADEFLEDAQRLPIVEFAARYGDAFLLHLGALGEDKFSVAMDETVMSESGGDLQRADPSLQSYYVVPLRGRADDFKTGPVTVGRSPDSDIVIDDMSLSKQHAIFDITDKVRLRDDNSRNGTFVDDRAAGAGLALDSGQAVRLGSVQFTFLSAADLTALVQRLKSAPAV